MAERKVLVKYYPPDFDPSKLIRTKKPKNNQQEVRLMLPMSVQCAACGEYIRKGKKFNGRKEEVVGENYLGIKIFRLYFRCSTCLNEITFKTDPQHSDYTVERGATRNYEPWKQSTKEEQLAKLKKEREEMGDSMKVLENRTEASKREIAIQDAIEEVRELNARAQGLTTDQLIGIHIGAAEQLEEEHIERMAREAFAAKAAGFNGAAGGAIPPVVRTLADPIDYDAAVALPASSLAASIAAASTPAVAAAAASTSPTSTTASVPVVKRLPDPPVDFDAMPTASSFAATAAPTPTPPPPAAAASASATSMTSLAPGLVVLKKRKHADEDPAAREQRKREKKEAKRNAAAAVATTASTAPAAMTAPAPALLAPATGLDSLLGAYDDDD